MLGASLILLAGCSQTSQSGEPITLPPLNNVLTTTSTTVLSVVTTNTEGYVNRVTNGNSFDLQVRQTIQRFVMQHIAVPDVSTCEGEGARALLASLIAGKLVRIDAEGLVWVGDIDVAGAMVAYGYAKAVANTRYVTADMNSVDYSCANTTTTTIAPAIIVVRPRTSPAVTRTTEAEVVETVVETDPPVVVTEPAPPPAAPEPPKTPATPRPVDPEPTTRSVDPEPEPTVDRTPRTPATPRLPDAPPASG